MVCVRPLCEGVDALTAMGSSCAGAAEAPEIRVDTDCEAVGTGKPSSTADASVPFRRDGFGGDCRCCCCRWGAGDDCNCVSDGGDDCTKLSSDSASLFFCGSNEPLFPWPLDIAAEASGWTITVPLRPAPFDVLLFKLDAPFKSPSTCCVAFLPWPRFMALVGESGEPATGSRLAGSGCRTRPGSGCGLGCVGGTGAMGGVQLLSLVCVLYQ